jgi:hypothetical protein
MNLEGVSVRKNFHNYVKEKLLSEVVSYNITPFEISQPMANLLSLIPGTQARARALGWLMTSGLVEASLRRKQLTKMVQAILDRHHNSKFRQGTDGIIQMPKKPQNVTPSRKVVGMHREATFDDLNDPELFAPPRPNPDDPIIVLQPRDLFSPVARKRWPILEQIEVVPGMSIDEYWEKYLEPRWMIIEAHPDYIRTVRLDLMSLRVDLKEKRDQCLGLGLEPFMYGSVNGYLQFVEKGDYLKGYLNRNPSDYNEQFGPSLDLKDSHVMQRDDDGNVIAHFIGGSSDNNPVRCAETIVKMRGQFRKAFTAKKLAESLKDVDPNTVQQIQKMLQAVNDVIKPIEKNPLKEGSRESPYKRIYEHDPVYGFAKVPINPDWPMQELIKFTMLGLDQEIDTYSENAFGNWNAIGPEFTPDPSNPQQNKPDQYWYRHPTEPNKRIFKLGKETQKRIYQLITEFEHLGHLVVRFEWTRLWPDCQPRSGTRFVLSTFFNKGVKSNPELTQDFRRVYYTIIDDKKEQRGVQPQQYQAIPVNINPKNKQEDGRHNEIIELLWQQGYRYELDEEEQKTGYPDWIRNDRAVLACGGSRFVIAPNEDFTQYFIYLPTNKFGNKVIMPSHGVAGLAMLAGGVYHSGGVNSGHANANIADKVTFEQLIQRMMNGELGEGVKANSILEIPSVKEGIKAGYAWFVNSREGRALRADMKSVEVEDAYGYALEALKSFSGDPAFQVGFITPDEMYWMLKWDHDRQQQEINKGEEGFTLQAQLAARKITGEVSDALIRRLAEEIRRSPMIDLSFLDQLAPDIKEIIERNGWEARRRYIAKYIEQRMRHEARKNPEIRLKVKQIAIEDLKKSDDEGGELRAQFSTRSQLKGTRMAPDEQRGEPIDPNDLRSKLGIELPPELQTDPADKEEPPPIDPDKAVIHNKSLTPKIKVIQHIQSPTTVGAQQPVVPKLPIATTPPKSDRESMVDMLKKIRAEQQPSTTSQQAKSAFTLAPASQQSKSSESMVDMLKRIRAEQQPSTTSQQANPASQQSKSHESMVDMLKKIRAQKDQQSN